jgi:hypothetical protein
MRGIATPNRISVLMLPVSGTGPVCDRFAAVWLKRSPHQPLPKPSGPRLSSSLGNDESRRPVTVI